MKLHRLIVAFILTVSPFWGAVNAKEFATSPNNIGGNTYLTDDTCRYDKTLPEAYTTDDKNHKTFACYFFGVTRIYFRTSDGVLRSLPKKDFQLINGVV